MFALVRLVRLATAAVVAVIVAGILIHLLDANTSNAIVAAIDDAARWLTQPFHGFFDPDRAKVRLAVNWGLAAVVYGIAGMLLAKLIGRARVGGRVKRPWGRRRAVH
jgi:hypothetical protein